MSEWSSNVSIPLWQHEDMVLLLLVTHNLVARPEVHRAHFQVISVAW